MKKVLTIAGSDCSGGAGIQADIKTMTVHKVYAMSVITALTAQNTTGVYGIMDATPDFVAQQLDCIFTDIFPDAVKIGMVSNIGIIEVIAAKLKQYGARNIVLDPVMIAASGGKLLEDDAVEAIKAVLFPVADIVTPNVPEAEALCGIEIGNTNDMRAAAQKIAAFYKGAILIKGGHLSCTASDLLYTKGEGILIKGKRIDNPNNHGTGCTLSSAIACNLASGYGIEESVRKAKKYISGALKAGLNLGNGSGPLNHFYKNIPGGKG